MKTNSQQSFLFRFKFSSKQFPLPTQFRSFLLTYSTTCSTQTLSQLQLKPRMLPDASEKSRSTFPNRWCPHVSFSLTPSSTNSLNTKFHCAFSAMTVPISLSLSALQYLYCQANHNASGFNLKITSQCKHPSSPTGVPAHYRTSGVQLPTSYFTNVATKPRSLTKQTDPPGSHANFSQAIISCHTTLQVLMPTFLFLTTISRHDARLSSTTHCALRASRINYNLTNLSRCNSFS